MKSYKPELTREADFHAFWAEELAQSARVPLNARMTRVEYALGHVEVYDIVYDGIDGTPIHGWYVVPAAHLAPRPCPVVIRYHGYKGNRGYPSEAARWALNGFAYFAMDIRGQGGLTPDNAVYPLGGIKGWITKGILEPRRHYMKYVVLDCIRAVDFVASREEIDAERIAVSGGSQGGGITLAVAGLDSRPKLAMANYPAMCNVKRAIQEMNPDGPYTEIMEWFRAFDPGMALEDQVYRTISYFDAMNFAPDIRADVLMAITLKDRVCPPLTSFAAFNHLTCAKELRVYPFFAHETVPLHNEVMMETALAFARGERRLSPAGAYGGGGLASG